MLFFAFAVKRSSFCPLFLSLHPTNIPQVLWAALCCHPLAHRWLKKDCVCQKLAKKKNSPSHQICYMNWVLQTCLSQPKAPSCTFFIPPWWSLPLTCLFLAILIIIITDRWFFLWVQIVEEMPGRLCIYMLNLWISIETCLSAPLSKTSARQHSTWSGMGWGTSGPGGCQLVLMWSRKKKA